MSNITEINETNLGGAVARDEEATPPTSEILQLVVTDPEVVAELRRHAPGVARRDFALAALRIGVQSVRAASGHVDAGAVREAGTHLVGQLQALLAQRGAELTGELTRTMTRYFDPDTGMAVQRLERLVRDGGELEQVLREHVGDESTLARTLAAQVGESSPIFRLLSPTEAGGLKAQLEQVIAAELRAQREQVLAQFSLDRKDSALSRLVAELKAGHAELGAGFKLSVETVVKEFSLDRPGSALSRLVKQVESAQKRISDEFSLDSKVSGLSKLAALLADTSAKIDRHLTLDDEQSALSRMKRELVKLIQDSDKRHAELATQVATSVAALTAQRAERARGNRHGDDFEAAVGEILDAEAQRHNDVCDAVGCEAGTISRCKAGDHVITLGEDSVAAGERVVIEAKEDKSYDLKKALAELEMARRNRDAQLGIFVFSKATAPVSLEPFGVYGASIVAVWDREDPNTDVVLRAGLSVARALAMRAAAEDDQNTQAFAAVEKTVRAIERHVRRAADIKTSAETAHRATDKIIKEAGRLENDLTDELAELEEQIRALRRGEE